tara:strand:+ start:66 stop:1376 length:1311 start_codon:yes stop_codon:yes gene_type:complete
MRKIENILSDFEKNILFISALFLPSALPISIFLILIAIIIFLFKNIKNLKNDYLNYLIFLLLVLMPISCFISYLNFDNLALNNYWNKSLVERTNRVNIWIDLLNWFPLFLIYWTCQKYLQSNKDRIKFAKYIFIGTFPVILSCILQYWFGIYGPFKFLFGSIVWFQKPLEEGIGVSGLFSNQNYAGSWLAATLPFSIFLILKNKNNLKKKLVSLLITLSHSYFLFLSNSRNALIGLTLILFLFLGFNGIWISILGLFLIVTFSYILYIISPLILNDLIQNFTSNPLIMKLSYFDISNFLLYPRIEILNISLNFISQKPVWGFGSGTFPVLYGLAGGKYDTQHTHNLALQIAYDYGVPIALILIFIIGLIFIRAFNKIFLINKKSNLLDKCWITSTAICLIYNFTDITYYDGKISILMWILFAGLTSINNEKCYQSN